MKRPPTELAARLRAVADEVLAADGAPSVDEVAAATQIPRATLYYYFAGRDELVDFLLLDKIDTAGAAVSVAVGSSQDPLLQLEAVLGAVVHTIASHPTLCTILLARLATLSMMEALTVAMEASVLRPLEELLDAGVAAGTFELEDAELSAHALYGAVSMAALSRFARDGHIDADQLVGALVPQLVASVRPGG
jgi:TetR/AcrR family transcriptional regulator